MTPYKPSEDIEQTPLLLPATPTSPDSLQTASGYFADSNGGAMSLGHGQPGASQAGGIDMFGSAFNFNHSHTSAFSSSNPFVQGHDGRLAMAENGGAFTNANMDESGYAKVSRNVYGVFKYLNYFKCLGLPTQTDQPAMGRRRFSDRRYRRIARVPRNIRRRNQRRQSIRSGTIVAR